MAASRVYTAQPGTSSAAVYTATNVAAQIAAFTVHNPTGGAVSIEAWIVPSGGSATDANKILSASILTGATTGFNEMVGQALNNGDALHLAAGSGASLTVHVTVDATAI